MKPSKRQSAGKRPVCRPDPTASDAPPAPSVPAVASRLLWGVDADAVATLCSVRIELPSRVFRSSTDRAEPFTGQHAIADAALVHRLTAVTPDVGLELPADRVEDPTALAAHAADAGVRIGSAQPDVSGRIARPLPLCHPDPDRADQALTALRRAAAVAAGLGARRFLLRWRDSAPYPGGAEAARRRARLIEVLALLRRQLPDEMALVVEYVVADPHPVRRPGPDWLAGHALAVGAGPGTKVLLDLTSVEPGLDSETDLSITTLRSADRLAGLVLGGATRTDQRFALFLAMIDAVEGGLLVRGRRCPLPFLLELPPDQPPGVEATLRAVGAVQDAAARAMLLDRSAWRAAQAAGDRAAANDVLLTAYESDASPLLTAVRAALGVPADALATYQQMCRDTHRVVERQRSVLRAALRRGALAEGAVAAEALAAADRSADGFGPGPCGGLDTRAAGRAVTGGRWPLRIGGLRGVG